jgi:hypothetical protein
VQRPSKCEADSEKGGTTSALGEEVFAFFKSEIQLRRILNRFDRSTPDNFLSKRGFFVSGFASSCKKPSRFSR